MLAQARAQPEVLGAGVVEAGIRMTPPASVAIEDRVQVHNPDPLDIGCVLDLGYAHAFVEWEDDSRSWALLDLLRVVD